MEYPECVTHCGFNGTTNSRLTGLSPGKISLLRVTVTGADDQNPGICSTEMRHAAVPKAVAITPVRNTNTEFQT
jgi:hypothetical protein